MAVYRYNKDVKYIPSGENLQVITGRDLHVQVVTVSEKKGSEVGNFTVVLPKVFLKYVMEEDDKRLGVWQNTPFKLWQTQLNFAVWCATSACGVGVKHLNNNHALVKSVYRFHTYYHIRRVIKRLQTPLPLQSSFNQYDNPYNKEAFLKLCSEYGVDSDVGRYRNKYFFSSWQEIRKYYDTPGLEYFNDDSASRWVIGDCRGFTKNGIFMISESVRAYVYLILTSQGASRSTIIGNTGSALAAQQSFINNFENVD